MDIVLYFVQFIGMFLIGIYFYIDEADYADRYEELNGEPYPYKGVTYLAAGFIVVSAVMIAIGVVALVNQW